MDRKFKGNCPYCDDKIFGYDNWKEGKICIQGFCKRCNIYILEDEVDWELINI